MIKLTKKIINRELVPHLSKGKRGPSCKVGLWRIVRAILKRLKTGLQWRELPMRELFGRHRTSWNSVFYYFSKWSKDGSWYQLWTALLGLNKKFLDMSSVELDGSQTPAKRGGECVGYQGRKKCKTTNMLFLTDRQGILLACSDPISGEHNDLFEIEKNVSKILVTLSDSNIEYKGLFMNADAGFDSQCFRNFCGLKEIIPNFDLNKRNAKDPDQNDYFFDNQLYKERFAVERTNAWLDGFKNLIIRYETKAVNWLGLHYLAFSIILLRKIEILNKKL
ncbi:MAG: IS5 family transposase [Phycisphaerales bacterium]|nr:IS5 family transposase [Phycisphaerales bacterium]